MSEVGRLLQQSLAAHREAAAARNQRRPEASDRLQTAARLRQEAQALDPSHTDPAWASEQTVTSPGEDTHEALMAFYRKKGCI